MKILHQPVRIKKILEEHDIMNHFNHPDLIFELHRFTKGEQILSSSESASDLMFLVQGTVQIYSIDDNGELFPVGLRTPATQNMDIYPHIEMLNGFTASSYCFFVYAFTALSSTLLP